MIASLLRFVVSSGNCVVALQGAAVLVAWEDGARSMPSLIVGGAFVSGGSDVLPSLLERVWASGGAGLAPGFEVGVAEPIA